MIAFLTSTPSGAYRRDEPNPLPVNSANGLLHRLQAHWPENARVLTIAADPDAFHINDSIETWYHSLFPLSGLSFSELRTCDSRDEAAVRDLHRYDVVILSGGHVPTQNAFFHKIGLREALQGYAGILISISAGTMNCAETVYAQPEMDGESLDPCYRRFLRGLGLTRRMLLPHYQAVKDDWLDGQRLFEDITYGDSYGREFYALPDGSYLLLENGAETICGECIRIRDGMAETICRDGETLQLG